MFNSIRFAAYMICKRENMHSVSYNNKQNMQWNNARINNE